MNRKEFLEQLQIALSGEVPQREVMSQLNYYDRYIRQESIHKSEEAVVEELGSPHLIAKTIIGAHERTYGKIYTRGSNSKYQQSFDYEDSRSYSKKTSKKSIFNIPWYKKLLLLLSILLLLLPIIIIGSLMIKFIIFLLPIILVVLLTILIVKLIQK